MKINAFILHMFPFAQFILTLDKTVGVSSSEAQRLKEANKNEAEKLLTTLKSELFVAKREILAPTGNITETLGVLPNKVKPKDIEDVTAKVAELYSVSSKLGEAIKLKDKIITYLNGLTFVDDYLKYEGKTLPTFNLVLPAKKQAVTVNGSRAMDTYCAFDKAEDLISHASQELLIRFGETNVKAILEIEAQAAHYGKAIHPGSFLDNLSKAVKESAETVNSNASIMVIQKNVLAYEKKDFETTEKTLQDLYTKYQKQRNSLFKQLKDLARELDQEYAEEYGKASREYNIAYQKHQMEVKEIYDDADIAKGKLMKEAAALRINI